MKKVIFFTLFLSLSITIIGQTILAVPMCKQKRSQWCWAASAEMIDKFHNLDHTNPALLSSQCDIVNFYLADLQTVASRYDPSLSSGFPADIPPAECCPTCMCDEGTVDGNFPVPYFHPSYFLGSTYHSVFLKLGYYSTMVKTMEFDQIVKEINYCMPLVLGIEYGKNVGERGNSGNHIVVVKGYEETTDGRKILHIQDPMDYNSCKIPEIKMLVFDKADNESVVSKIDFYLAGIMARNKRFCDSCLFENDPFVNEEPRITVSGPQLRKVNEDLSYEGLIKRLERVKDFYKIPVNYIKIKSARSFFVRKNYKDLKYVISRDTDFYYFKEKENNILTKELVNKQLKITQVKTGNYPLTFTIKDRHNNNPFVDLTKDKDVEFELFRAYGPLYKEYYYVKKDKEEYFFDPKDFQISPGNKIDASITPINKRTLRKELKAIDFRTIGKQLNIPTQLGRTRARLIN